MAVDQGRGAASQRGLSQVILPIRGWAGYPSPLVPEGGVRCLRSRKKKGATWMSLLQEPKPTHGSWRVVESGKRLPPGRHHTHQPLRHGRLVPVGKVLLQCQHDTVGDDSGQDHVLKRSAWVKDWPGGATGEGRREGRGPRSAGHAVQQPRPGPLRRGWEGPAGSPRRAPRPQPEAASGRSLCSVRGQPLRTSRRPSAPRTAPPLRPAPRDPREGTAPPARGRRKDPAQAHTPTWGHVATWTHRGTRTYVYPGS